MKNFPDQKELPKIPTKEQMEAIGSYIIDGMSLEESCVLTGYPEEDMKILIERDPKIAAVIRKKNLEFKHKHLVVVGNDPKKADWMLERRFPEEFGKNADLTPPQSVNILQLIMQDIQNGYDLPGQMLEAAKATIVAGEEKQAPKKIRETEVTIDSVLK